MLYIRKAVIVISLAEESDEKVNEQNVKWIDGRYEELKQQYTDEWIAVMEGKVIDHDSDLSHLVERLNKKYSDAYNEIAVEYIATKEIDLIL